MLTDQQEKKKIQALKNIAKAFRNLGYETDTAHTCGVTIKHPLGTSFYIYSDYLGRTKCSASQLKSKVQHYSYGVHCESIGFDIFKPTEKIVSDIEKRFLNQFIEASHEALKVREERDAEETNRQNTRHAVAKLFNEKLTPEYSGEIISGYVGENKNYVRADIKSDSLINLTLNDLSLEQVARIKQALLPSLTPTIDKMIPLEQIQLF